MGDPISIRRPTQAAAQRGSAYEVASRAIDLALAVAGLALALPVLLFLLPAVSVSTGAWPLFRQVRIGKDAKLFRLTKIRTMPRGTPAQLPRQLTEHLATPLGRVLRKYKLDEIPQLFDVIKGKMSLVGPRPIISEEYGKESHHARLAVRPGVTGFWQISPCRDMAFDECPEFDLYYLANRSIGFDLWILWRTLLFVLLGRDTGFDQIARRQKQAPAAVTASLTIDPPAAGLFRWASPSGNGSANGKVAGANGHAETINGKAGGSNGRVAAAPSPHRSSQPD